MREWQSQSHVRWYCRYHYCPAIASGLADKSCVFMWMNEVLAFFDMNLR